MGAIVVIGGGLSGLCGAMMLARDGHRVTVLERDPAPPVDPALAWQRWERRGVVQFHLPHGLLPRFREVMDAELPDVITALEGAGALRTNRIAEMPAAVTGGLRPGDERFDQVTGRRPVLEAVIARLAADEPGVEIRRGVAVRALSVAPGADGVADVQGVVTDGGETVRADLVLDAGGRRSAVPALLEAAGARAPVERRADSGYVYYGRHFRSEDGSVPPLTGPPLQTYDSVQIATLAADHGHWSVVLVTSGRDRALRPVRDPDLWQRVVGAYPLVAPWIRAEPTTGVDIMATIEDRQRSFLVDGRPVVNGLVAVGDARACTNPGLGRGISIAAVELAALRAVLREAGVGDRPGLVRRWEHHRTEAVEPWVADTLASSAHRLASLEADIDGVAHVADDPAWHMGNRLLAAAPRDPELLRAAMDVGCLLARGRDVMTRPGIVERVRAVGDVPPPPGPDRDELLAIVGGAARRRDEVAAPA